MPAEIGGTLGANVWELVWLMVIMKIPILYLCWVVYWAIKSKPQPEEHAAVDASVAGPDSPGWSHGRAPRRPGPHGRPTRSYARTARATVRV